MPDPTEAECREALEVMLESHGRGRVLVWVEEISRRRQIDGWIAEGMPREEAEEWYEELRRA